MKYQFRASIVFVGILILGVMLVGEILLGIPWLESPLWVKVFIAVSTFALVFLFILSGRDFFSVYLYRSLLVLLLLYCVAFFSMALMTRYSQTTVYNYKVTDDTIAQLQREGTPNDLVVKLNKILGREFIGQDAFSEEIKKIFNHEDATKYEQPIVKHAFYRPTLNFVTPGTVMVLFLAVVTVIGFTITITRLQESHMRISGYEEFLIRLGRFLDLALHAHRPPDVWINQLEWKVRKLLGLISDDFEGLKVLCTVPTLGNISHHDLFYGKVYDRWKHVAWAENLKVEMISITPSLPDGVNWDHISAATREGRDLYNKEDFTNTSPKNINRNRILKETPIGNFYKTFSGRGFEEEAVIRGMVEALDVIRTFESQGQNNYRIVYDWNSRDDSPPVHLFWTRSRALVAIPLDRGIPVKDFRKAITMVGYETTDQTVIERLLEVYNEWKAEILRRQTLESSSSSTGA